MPEKKADAKDYTPEERLAIVIEGMSGEQNITDLTEKYGISRDTYYVWKRQLQQFLDKTWGTQNAGRKPKDKAKDLTQAQSIIEKLNQQQKEMEKEIFNNRRQMAIYEATQDHMQMIIDRVPDDLKKNLAFPYRARKNSKKL